MVHIENNKFKGFIRSWRLFCPLLVLAVVVIMLFLQWPREYEVSLVTEAGSETISTKSSTVGELLTSLGMEPQMEDYIAPALEQELQDGLTIQYIKAKPVTLYVGAVDVFDVKTTQPTVEALLRELEISVGNDDEVEPSLTAPVVADMSIRVTRIEHALLSEEELNQKRNRVRVASITSVIDTPQIEQSTSGELRYWYDVTFVNGEPVSHVLKEVEIVKSGLRFEPRQVLENVELTAYGAGVEHTGKSPGDHGYGITASGKKVQDQHTIAVDPQVIPLGWWVYIEGYGLRRAEDTGSAVKGKRIDLYYEDDAMVDGFGLKKGYTVYLIGPEKPNF